MGRYRVNDDIVCVCTEPYRTSGANSVRYAEARLDRATECALSPSRPCYLPRRSFVSQRAFYAHHRSSGHPSRLARTQPYDGQLMRRIIGRRQTLAPGSRAHHRVTFPRVAPGKMLSCLDQEVHVLLVDWSISKSVSQ